MLRENTRILFTGDNGTDKPIVSTMNGWQVAGAKRSMGDGGTRAPLIVNWPGVVSRDKVSSDLVDFSDISNDVLEKHPIVKPSPKAQQVRAMLRKALDKYKNSRPVEVVKNQSNRRLFHNNAMQPRASSMLGVAGSGTT